MDVYPTPTQPGPHVNRGHDSAHPLRRVSVDSVRATMGLSHYVDEAPEQCEARRALAKAAHIPIAGTSVLPMFNGK